MSTLATIEHNTKTFADKRQNLNALVQRLQDDLECVKRHHLPAIKAAAEDVAESQAVLHSTIKDSKDAFKSPKTMIISGVRVGYKKEKGKIVFDDEATVIKLIRKNHPELADTLIKESESVLKTPLAQLSAAELKKLGVEVTADTDQVLIKPVDNDIDKLVTALLEEGEQILKDAV
ncbi:host-nuclease inhibitor Gam family protein [uncultured Desulfuromonas sp.]|uniref:host-nuclease inhibitor Gam family protein n=1 Tax=uncultured Desulfuromonas sp. TaxID=181013 RepID=UPI002AABA251|nr:host-nuclease inhibitor Gam family protein [uncultured Desulfuromonas sp.]